MRVNSQYHFARSIISLAVSLRSQCHFWLVKALSVSRVIIRLRQDLRVRSCKYFYFLLLISVFLLINCCGYSTRSLLPGYMHKVHVKIFENQTYKTGLDEIATESTIEAFRKNSNLKIVSEDQADIVVNGKVTGFSKEPYVYTGALNVSQYKITIKFSVICLDQVKNTIFWQGDVSDWATYTDDEDAGIKDAIKKTAERLVTIILTNW